jgi:hypothetical protein
MTTVVLASSILSGSLLSMLVPIAAVIVIVAWGVFLIKRHERHREQVDVRNRAPAGADAPQVSRSPQA